MKQLNITSITAAMLAMMAASCSSASDEPGTGDENPGYSTEHVQLDDEYIMLTALSSGKGALNWQPEVKSRDGEEKHPVEADFPPSIGVYGYNNSSGMSYSGAGEVFRNVEFFHINGELFGTSGITSWVEGNDWPYVNPMPWITNTRYKFFCYSPYTVTGTDGIEARTMSYDGFNRIVWHHIPKYSAEDYTICHKILEYRSKMIGEGVNPAQLMHMRHIQARVRFCFKLGPKMAELRVIRVKQIEVVNLRGLNMSYIVDFDPNIVVDAAEGNSGHPVVATLWDYEPITDETLHNITLNNEQDSEHRRIPYIELSKENNETEDFQPLASVYVYPGDPLQALTIRVTYDVYDLRGQLLREDDHATNTINLNLAASGSATGRVLEAGYYYDVKLIVEPSYLYVLSDNDFAPDGYFLVD